MTQLLFQNKYRIPSIRLKKHDYSLSRYYFITICTHNKQYILGKIMNNKMGLSRTGIIVNNVWKNLPKHYSNCVLDEFVIMPNHIHAIIYIQYILGNKKHTLSDVVRSFKSFSTREINRIQKTPGNLLWQTRFYENIVRDGNALESIRQYIRDNPLKWYRDRNNFCLGEEERRV